MTIHYTNEHGKALCNNAGFYSGKTKDLNAVTCRSCMKVLAGEAARVKGREEWSNKDREGSSGYRTGEN